MNKRAKWSLLLFLAALVLAASLVWIGIHFTLPQPEWVLLGKLEDFPPAAEPYRIRDVAVFVVNDGGEMTVLSPRNPAPGGVNVNWNATEQAFIDPSRGAWFSLQGIPVQRAMPNSLVETQSLPRHQVKIENGLVYINLQQTRIISLEVGE